MVYNEKRNQISQKYNKEHLEQIAIRVKKGKRTEYKQIAEHHNLSMAALISYMVENTEVENIVVGNNTVNEMTNTFIENTNSLVNETVEKNIVENTNQTIVNNTENVRENQEENQSI